MSLRGRISPSPRATRALTIAAFLVVAIALGLAWLQRANTDLQPLNEMAGEAAQVYLPALRGQATASNVFFHDQAPAAHALKIGLLRVNGQWDARVLGIAGLGLQVAALGILLTALGRCLRLRWLAALGFGATVLIALSPLGPRPMAPAAAPSGVAALSLLHLFLMSRKSAASPGWWLGLACGCLNIAAASAGIASAAALVLWSLGAGMRDRAAWRRQTAGLAANGALLAVGLALAAVRSGSGVATPGFWESWPALLPWPFEHPAWCLFVWAPAILCIAKWARRKSGRADLAPLSLLALWAVLQTFALAKLHPDAAASFRELMMAGLIVDAACFTALTRRGWQWATRNLALISIWGILVGNALLQPGPHRVEILAGPAIDAPVTVALRLAVADGNAGAAGQPSLSDPAIRDFLPGSIRPALPVARSSDLGPAFLLLPGRDDLPAFAVGALAAGVSGGEFVSQPLETKFSLLQFRIAGEFQPPATALALRLADGTEITPLQKAFHADVRWKRVNFPAPRGFFRIVARDAGPTARFAFTAPQELGRLSWLAGKWASAWGWWLAGGLILFLGVAAAALTNSARPRPAEPAPGDSRVAWPIVPWLALFAYALFFSFNLDTTAGPNDSGGYLNSAKLLAHGHVTAAPRMIFGPAAGETDISPYLPGTFHETGDKRMAPTYPVGFPMEICAAAWILPLATAVPTVMLLQLVLGVLFTRRLARVLGLPDGWAWMAGGVVGLSPVYLFQALQPLSDGPALVWVTAAVAFAWTSRTRPWHAVLAGLATALAVLIRPSNILCVFPVLVCLAGAWPQLALWILAGLPGAAWQMWYNHKLYGSPLVTGYGELNGAFAPLFVPLTLRSYLRWLPALFTPVIWLAFFGPFLRSIPLRARLVLATWVAAFMVFYAFYWCTYDNWYNMRFVLPAAPAIVILALFVLRNLSQRAGLAIFAPGSPLRSAVPAVALISLLFGLLAADGMDRRVLYWMRVNRIHATGAIWARDHFPPNAVVFARHGTGSLMYYTDLLTVRSDTGKSKSLEFLEQVARTGRPIRAYTYHWERRGYQWGNGPGDGRPDLPGNWERLAVLCHGEIYAWPAGRI